MDKFFLLISFITSCAALAMLIGQIVGLVFQSNNGPVEYVLRFYTIVLCIVCIMVEYEWTAFGRESKILHFWITRGLYYAFIGVLGLDQIDNSGDTNSSLSWSDMAHNYIFVVAWAILLCGCLYFFMGLFCLQIVHDKLRKDYDERCQQAPNVQQTISTYQEANNNV